MQCNEIQEHLYDYLTDRLSPTLKPVIAQHLMSCSACRAEHDEIKITLGLLDQAKPPRVSDGFTNKVMQSLEPKVIPFTKRPAYRYVMQGATAAIVVLAVVSIIKLMPGSEQGISTTRGGSSTIPITDDCKKSIELYNKGTGTPDRKLKESLLKDALAAGCTEKKVLARIYNNLADCYEQQDRIDDAIAGYTKAIELDPQFYTAHIGLGDFYKKSGQTKKAINSYYTALNIMRETKADFNKIKELENMLTELEEISPKSN